MEGTKRYKKDYKRYENLKSILWCKKGFVDEVISPEETRGKLIISLKFFDDSVKEIIGHRNISL